MNIGPGNIEALLLDALEGRLSASDAELVWAALEAHPEWGVSWDFEDRDLPRLQAEDVTAMDWSALKKEVVTDQQIRQALRQDRERHTLDASVKLSLYRRQERVLWRYWVAAASVALMVWMVWPAGKQGDVTLVAKAVEIQAPADTISNTGPSPFVPTQAIIADAVNSESNPSKRNQEHIIIENCTGTPEQIQEEVIDKVLPLSAEEWIVAQGNDTTSLEAPLQLPFDLPPTQNLAEVEPIIPAAQSSTKTESNTYTPLEWLKMKAQQIASRKEADGTLPTVRRDKQSFSLQWGSLSINAH
jgi:hypothetical protein